jgi:trehalose 6-phosphate phosphatase
VSRPLADSWTVEFDGWDPADEGRRETLCTLGNGRFATRGAVAESAADGVHYPGTYAAGCYNRLPDEIAGRSLETESMPNLPNWLELRFAVADGEWFDLSRFRILDHRVTLDLRRGVLTRRVRFADAAGRRTSVRQRRFVHMARPHLTGLHTVVTAEDWTGRLRLVSGLDGAVANTGVRRYEGMSSRHLEIVSTAEVDPSTIALVASTTQSQVRIAQVARTRVTQDGDPVARCSVVTQPERVAHEFSVELKPGQAAVVEKVVALVTSRDVAIADPATTASALAADAPSFDELLADHTLAWHQLWRRFRIELRDGRRRCRHPAHAAPQRLSPATVGVAAQRRPRRGHPGARSSR